MADSRQVAFTLKESVVDDFSGGTIAFGINGETYDIKKALDDGGGTIVTDDERLIEVLDAIDVLKHTSVSKAEAAAEPAEEAEPVQDENQEATSDSDAPKLESLSRVELDALAADKLDDYDPVRYATRSDVIQAIIDGGEEA